MKSQETTARLKGGPPMLLLLLIGFCFWCLLVLPFRDGVLHANEKQQSPKKSHILQRIIIYLVRSVKIHLGTLYENKFKKKKVISLTCVNLMKS